MRYYIEINNDICVTARNSNLNLLTLSTFDIVIRYNKIFVYIKKKSDNNRRISYMIDYITMV